MISSLQCVKVKVKLLNRVRLFAMNCKSTRLLHPWDFPGKNTAVGCHFLLQGIFPTQGTEPGLLHCRQILDHLNHQGYSTLYCKIDFVLDGFDQR